MTKPGSLPIDLQFPAPIGRLHIRSGTTRKATRNAMRDMLRTLHQIGHGDKVVEVKEGRVTVLELYEKYRIGRIDQMPSGEVMCAASVVYQEWLDGKELAPKTRKDYGEAKARVLAFGAPGATMVALPKLLEAHRRASIDVHPRTFNQDRAAWMSCLRRVLGPAHWLTYECSRVEQLSMPDNRKMAYNPQTVAQVREWAGKFEAKGLGHHALTVWGIALTGMRPEEFFEEAPNTWEMEDGLVRINGTKTKAAKRIAPRLGLIIRSSTTRETFGKAFRTLTSGTVTPYDLRRSYSQWLDDAHIPEYRQQFYFGHGPENVTQLYKRMRDCLPHLAADTAALLDLVSEPVGLKVVR